MADKKVGVPTVSVGTNSGASVDLYVMDRLIMDKLFPEEGSIEEQEYARVILKKVLIEQDEASDVALTVRDNRMSFNQMKDFSRTFKFSYGEIQFLKNQVERLDREKKIKSQMLSLCQRVQAAKCGK